MQAAQQQIIHADNLAWLEAQPSNSIDYVVTDPPYGLGKVKDIYGLLREWMNDRTGLEQQTDGFMGSDWDVLPAPVFWRELLRVTKPGGHVAAFAGSRTQDLMALSMRLAGWEIRNVFAWMYGSGFPKSLDVSKAIDKEAGASREVIGQSNVTNPLPRLAKKHNARPYVNGVPSQNGFDITAPATDAAKTFDGYGTDLKPAYEPIILARKPFSPPVAANVLAWATGGLNLGACKVGNERITRLGGVIGRKNTYNDATFTRATDHEGRFPPNLLFSHSLFCTPSECATDCPVRELDRQSGTKKPTDKLAIRKGIAAPYNAGEKINKGDEGGASRYFPNFYWQDEEIYFLWRYTAKASTSERNAGLKDVLPKETKIYNGKSSESSQDVKPVEERFTSEQENTHPTVKPVKLMQWLIQLLAPPQELNPVGLDPFVGSGTTCLAAHELGFKFIGLERKEKFYKIAAARLEAKKKQLRFDDLLVS